MIEIFEPRYSTFRKGWTVFYKTDTIKQARTFRARADADTFIEKLKTLEHERSKPTRDDLIEDAISLVYLIHKLTREQLFSKQRLMKYVNARLDLIARLRAMEIRQSKIALIMGCDHSTVANACKKLDGIPKRPKTTTAPTVKKTGNARQQ